jgi:hypothetical protein
MNENWVRNAAHEHDADLLVGPEEIDIDSIQTALGGGTDSEEEGIDVT